MTSTTILALGATALSACVVGEPVPAPSENDGQATPTPHVLGAPAQVWFTPPFAAADSYVMFDRSRAGMWDAIAGSFSVFKFYIGTLDPDPGSLLGLPADQLDFAVEWLVGHGKETAVELGGTLGGVCSGASSAQLELAGIAPLVDRLRAHGRELDYLVLDGPLSRTIAGGRAGNCGWDLATSVRELGVYLRTVRAQLPATRFVLLTNFPNWSYQGDPGYLPVGWASNLDYAVALDAVVAETQHILTTTGEDVRLHGLQIDNPWSFYLDGRGGVSHRRMARLIAQAESRGMVVTVIANTDRGLHVDPAAMFANTVNPAAKGAPPVGYVPGAHGPRDAVFHNDSVLFADYLLSNFPSVRGLVVQSWHTAPYAVFPQNFPGVPVAYSMIQILNEVASHVHRGVCTLADYRALRPDVAAHPHYGVRLMEHWIAAGKAEGNCEPRQPGPGENVCSPYEYLLRRPDLLTLVPRMDPATHHAQWGQAEGMCAPILASEPKPWL